MTATGMSAAATWHPEGDDYSRTQCHPVPLDAPDVALRGQRLMAYKKRLRREEGQASQESGRAQQVVSTPDGTTGSEARVRRTRTPLLVDRLADAEELVPPTQQREDELELFREPSDAPKIGRRPLDMRVPHQPRCPDARPAMLIRPDARSAMPIPRQRHTEMLFDDDPSGMSVGPRYTARPTPRCNSDW